MKRIFLFVFAAVSILSIQTSNASAIVDAFKNGLIVSVTNETELIEAVKQSPGGVFLVNYQNEDQDGLTVQNIATVAKTYASQKLFIKISRDQTKKLKSDLGQKTYLPGESVSLMFFIPHNARSMWSISPEANVPDIRKICTNLTTMQARQAREFAQAKKEAKMRAQFKAGKAAMATLRKKYQEQQMLEQLKDKTQAVIKQDYSYRN